LPIGWMVNCTCASNFRLLFPWLKSCDKNGFGYILGNFFKFWIQSYDYELQHCNNLQHTKEPSAFLKQIYFVQVFFSIYYTNNVYQV
jgi:hypothetical protein